MYRIGYRIKDSHLVRSDIVSRTLTWYVQISYQGLSLGTFRTSPVQSLYVEANEPSLENRRMKLGMQHSTKLMAYPSNPVCDCVCNPLYENIYDIQPNTIQSFGLLNSYINLDYIAPIVIPQNLPVRSSVQKLMQYF
jgi:hypothetical protein